MVSAEVLDDVLSADELSAAIDDFSKADWVRLRKVAIRYSWYRNVDPAQIVQEAIKRALCGQRRCPRDISVVRFLAEAIRSLCSSAGKSQTKRREVSLTISLNSDETFDPGYKDDRPNVEEALIADQDYKKKRNDILEVFADDIIAQTIVEGMMEDMRGEDLCELAGIDKTTLATKRKLISRRLDKFFPEWRKK